MISCIMAFDDHSKKSFLIITACECEFRSLNIHFALDSFDETSVNSEGEMVDTLSPCSHGVLKGKSLILSTRGF
mgnify:CR=1 FL=1